MNQKETNKKAFCEFVKICCDALEIGEVPPIFVNSEKLKTETMAACCEYDGEHWRIYTREIPDTVPDPLIFVSMAHDLRRSGNWKQTRRNGLTVTRAPKSLKALTIFFSKNPKWTLTASLS